MWVWVAQLGVLSRGSTGMAGIPEIPKARIMLLRAGLGALEQMLRAAKGSTALLFWHHLVLGWVGGTSQGKGRLSRSCTNPFRSCSAPGHCKPGPTSHLVHSNWRWCLKISAFTHFSWLCRPLICGYTAPGIFLPFLLEFRVTSYSYIFLKYLLL